MDKKRITGYYIAYAEDMDDLADKVREDIFSGCWEPIGGPYTQYDSQEDKVYIHQAMVKFEYIEG